MSVSPKSPPGKDTKLAPLNPILKHSTKSDNEKATKVKTEVTNSIAQRRIFGKSASALSLKIENPFKKSPSRLSLDSQRSLDDKSSSLASKTLTDNSKRYIVRSPTKLSLRSQRLTGDKKFLFPHKTRLEIIRSKLERCPTKLSLRSQRSIDDKQSRNETGNKRRNLERNSTRLSLRSQYSSDEAPSVSPSRDRNYELKKNANTSRLSSWNTLKSKTFITSSKHLIPKNISASTIPGSRTLTAYERVTENNKLKVYQNVLKKLQEVQSDFIHKFSTLKMLSPVRLKSEYKFITMVVNNECKLVVKDDDMQKIPKTFPARSVSDFKRKIGHALENSLLTLKEIVKTSHSKLQLEVPYYIEEIHTQLEIVQAQKLHELNEYVDQLCGVKTKENEPDPWRMQRELEETKKSLQRAEETIAELKIFHAEEMKLLERRAYVKKLCRFSDSHDELTSRIPSSSSKYSFNYQENEELQRKIQICEENICCLNEKLIKTESLLKSEKRQKEEKMETIHRQELELKLASEKIEELRNSSSMEINQRITQLSKEISNLQLKLELAESEKQFERKLKFEKSTKLRKAEADLKASTKKFEELRLKNEGKFQEMEDIVTLLQQKLDESEQQKSVLMDDIGSIMKEFDILKQANNSDAVELLRATVAQQEMKNVRESVSEEIAKLQRQDSEKRREIKSLKMELSKAHYGCTQLQDQIYRDQHLLKLLSEWINSLRFTEMKQRIQVENLYEKLIERSNTVAEMTKDYNHKYEDFEQFRMAHEIQGIELLRQADMLKLLEQTNNRNQALQKSQQERISQMEKDMQTLKQSSKMPMTLFKRVNGENAPENISEHNTNVYYFATERRRKRQVDINVKKYEN